ncbi:39S ribosomal protein S18a, mitochondrial [Nilaparvata lugens]|uniref:39S ribosomal protein S18a, mitochondrial n=1 Tax=Nilaparvata lugens TaxID=108931 RepID=UPI000B991CC5|nr:39S ribosomal protein S18a, mitochondrial [Nilaparvata lugens]
MLRPITGGLVLLKQILSKNNGRSFSVAVVNRVKEIIVTKDDKKTIIEGILKPSDRVNLLLDPPADSNPEACSICRLDVDIKHTDVLLLSQFMRSDGGMLPRRVTGLCRTQQKRMSKLVTMALKAGLMPNLAPANSKRDPARRDKFKKNHRYYDESTIRPPFRLKYPTDENFL